MKDERILRITYNKGKRGLWADHKYDTPLKVLLESNDGLTDDEICALSNLKLNEYHHMGVHFGWVTFQRIK